ncbi:MAG: tRNA (adenine(22)-N(1))-methyltransferase TrmK [Paenisporosarcina sp.]
MNAQYLSERLTRVAFYVAPGAIVADIGSDHAYLPCYLIYHGIASKVIAGEVAKGPFESALNHVNEEQLEKSITVRLANGLKAIHIEDCVDTITIAGMGGPLIATILEQDKELLSSVSKLILQPNIHSKAIREWALMNEWRIVAEEILIEDDKIYEILVLEKGTMTLSEAEVLFGPFLLVERNNVFLAKWNKEAKEWKRILEAIKSAELTTEVKIKKEEVEHRIALVKEVLDV